MEHITKHYGGVYAANDISFELRRGEVLALVGDNGAGKSTLVKVLAGAITASSGTIYVNGKEVKIEGPRDAQSLGIETIHQNLALMNNLDIPSNIFMGREIQHRFLPGLMNLKNMRKKAEELLDTFEIKIGSVDKVVGNLSGGQRQMVAISRAVYFEAQIIIMDEPTAALGVAETKKVYEFIERLRSAGISVIIISHNINEVYEVADRFMVLKTGTLVDVVEKSEAAPNEIVRMIISGAPLHKPSAPADTESEQQS